VPTVQLGERYSDAMTPQERSALEVERRIALLPAEVNDWLEAANANVGGLGIHRSQLNALGEMMGELTDRQRRLLAQRPAPAATGEYAAAEIEISAEILGAWELWAAFRNAFEQRRDKRLVESLDAADLVTADGYRTALERAVAWGLVTPTEFREPPLVCGDAVGGPATAARGREAAGVSGTIRRFRGQRLPIPVVLFPADRLDNVWTFATLAHEVGHDLEADLAFTSEAIELVDGALGRQNVPAERREAWEQWGKESVADAVGVVLGGAGFASSLAAWLLPIAPDARFGGPGGDAHAPPHLRVKLLGALLRAAAVPGWDPLSVELERSVDEASPHAWQAPFFADAETVATVMLTRPLSTLTGHALRELVPDIAADAALSDRLARYLRTGFQRDPVPAGPPPFPFRLVPCAAELAVRTSAGEPDLDGIASRSLAYLGAIPRPEFLAAPAPGRREFLRGLARQLDVRPPAPDQADR
jgi:hypothetical protein